MPGGEQAAEGDAPAGGGEGATKAKREDLYGRPDYIPLHEWRSYGKSRQLIEINERRRRRGLPHMAAIPQDEREGSVREGR